MSDTLTLIIESCYDCPRLKQTPVRNFLLGNQTAYRYDCTKAGRQISPQDGVNPPPKWCPLRKPEQGEQKL